METILAIFGLFLIPLSIRYIFNPSRVRPLVGIPAESIFLTGAFLLLKPSIASSLTFGTHNTLSNLEYSHSSSYVLQNPYLMDSE